MTERTCTIPGCDRPHSGRGWCARHYGKWRKTGDPNYTKPTAKGRFDAKVNKTETCWLWIGYIDPDGYGKSWNGRRTDFAHRVSYEMHVGPIPDGLQIDHLCHVRNCVNPDHLEPVTAQENNRRSTSATALNMRKGECLKGHPFTPENTYLPRRGGRQCLACRRAADRVRTRSA